jgi:hypothetical protein
MFRSLTFIGVSAALLLACGNENELGIIDAELEISPSLTDLGTIPVGEIISFVVQLDHAKGGEISIKNVSVTNIEGDFFSFSGESSFSLDRSATAELELLYTPTSIGYHRATVEIAHNGIDSPAVVDVRGHAILPEATVYPMGLDFGPVSVGGTSQRALTVANQSGAELTLTVDDAAISNSVFSVISEVPFQVSGGDELVINLEFAPIDDSPALGQLSLKAGSVELPAVALRGNDCENGDPEQYDVDNDGFTLCGGDCDDNNADVHPGAQELPNAIDDNCNMGVDENTTWADDDGDGYCEDPYYCSDGAMGGDCADNSDLSLGTANINPGATEIMDNGIDDDCDGIVDQGTTDFDGDGYSPEGGDCDDMDATVYPGAPELADWIDNDCDVPTDIDEGTVLADDDGDGYCEDPTQCSDGSVLYGDCDDSGDLDGDGLDDGRPTNPGAIEQPDWQDNDCDGIVDEGTVNYDDDGDGYTEVGGDCDDSTDDLDGDGVFDGAALSPALGTCP